MLPLSVYSISPGKINFSAPLLSNIFLDSLCDINFIEMRMLKLALNRKEIERAFIWLVAAKMYIPVYKFCLASRIRAEA